MRRAVRLLACALVGLLAATVMLSEQALHPLRRETADLPPGWQRVTLPLAGDHPLVAAYRPSDQPSRCLLILHGVGDSSRGTLPLGQNFATHGFRVLVPDSRAHGSSGGSLATYGLLERGDVIRWADWLRSQACPEGVYAYGASMGGAILLQALGAGARIEAAAVESPFSSFHQIAVERIGQVVPLVSWFARPMALTAFAYARLRYGLDLEQASPLALASHIRQPVLLIHGEEDRNIVPAHSVALSRALPAAQLWLVPHADHIQARSWQPEEFDRRLLDTFQRPATVPSARTERAYGNPQTRQ